MDTADGGPGNESERPRAGAPAVDGVRSTTRRGRLVALLEQHLERHAAPPDRAESISRPGSEPHGIGHGAGGSSEVSWLTQEPAAEQSRWSPGGRWWLQRVCVVAVSEVDVDGAGITVMGSLEAGLSGARDQLGAAGALARHLEDLQLAAGEGPCLDAYATGLPVLAADLSAETTRWLGFGPEALAAGAAAVFSLPLQVGAVRLGTLDLYRARPGPLSTEQYADALVLATLATQTLLDLADDPGRGESNATGAGRPGWLSDVHADVHVASGMVSAQAGIDIRAALMRIRAHAFASSERIGDVARRIVDRRLVLDTSVSGGPVLDHPGSDPPTPTGSADPTDPVDLPLDPENDP